jgi:hypothetical protein
MPENLPGNISNVAHEHPFGDVSRFPFEHELRHGLIVSLAILGAQHRRVAERFRLFQRGITRDKLSGASTQQTDPFDILRSKLISFRKGAGISPVFGGRMRFASDV